MEGERQLSQAPLGKERIAQLLEKKQGENQDGGNIGKLVSLFLSNIK